MSWFLMPLRLLAPIGPLLLLLAVPGHAREVSARQIDELARDVAATESVRAVEDLQRAYAQYAQFGLWQEMAALFSNDARIVWGETTVDGKTAIADWL